MHLYDQHYAECKPVGISKREWEECGYELFQKLLKFVGVRSTKNLSVLAQHFQYQEYESGSFLLSENQFPLKLYFIITGTVRLYTLVDTMEITRFLLGPGNFVSSVNFFNNRPSEINIEACSKCRVLAIDAKDLLFHTKNGWGIEIMKFHQAILAKGFAYCGQISDIRQLPAPHRIKQLEILCPFIFEQFSAKYIAGLLGMRVNAYGKLKGEMI